MTIPAPVFTYRRFNIDYQDTARTTAAAVGNDVRSATDGTGSGNHLTMPSGAVPTAATGGGLVFASTGGRALQNTLVLAQPFVLLLRFTYPTSGDYFLISNKGSPDSWYIRPQATIFSIKGSGGSPIGAPMWAADSTPRVAGALFDGTSSKIYVDGTITAVSGSSVGAATGLSVGCYIPGNNALNFPGTVTDIGAWSGSYTDAEIAEMAAVLSANGTQLSRLLYPPEIMRAPNVFRTARMISIGGSVTPTPPSFDGVASFGGVPGVPGRLHATWAEATDANVTSDQIRYEIFVSQTSPPPTDGAPTVVTAFGATSWDGDGFDWDGPWYVIVRARNAFGLSDANTVELSGTPTADTTAPDFAGATFGARTAPTEGRVAWGLPSDGDPIHDATYITVDVYAATTSGGQDLGGAPSASALAVAGSVVLNDLVPTATYYAIARATDASGNQDANTVEVVIPPAVIDDTPPTIEDVTPPAGTLIARDALIGFTVIDAGGLRRAIVTVTHGAAEEVVHNGDSFVGAYRASSRAPVTNGVRYTVRRSGGWATPPTFAVYAFDLHGNEAT